MQKFASESEDQQPHSSQNRRSVTFSSRSKKKNRHSSSQCYTDDDMDDAMDTESEKSRGNCNNPWKKSQQKKGRKTPPISKKVAKHLPNLSTHGTARQVQELSTVTNSKNDRDGSKLEDKVNEIPSEDKLHVSGESKVLHSNTAIQNGASTEKISPDTPANALEDTNNALSLELEGVKAERDTLQAELVKMKITLKERESKLKDELSQALKRSNEDRQREQNDFETKFANVKRDFENERAVLESKVLEMKSILEGEKSKNQELEEQTAKIVLTTQILCKLNWAVRGRNMKWKLTSFKMM